MRIEYNNLVPLEKFILNFINLYLILNFNCYFGHLSFDFNATKNLIYLISLWSLIHFNQYIH